MQFIFGRTCLAIAYLGSLCEAMRSMHGIRSGHLECSSAVRRAPTAPKETLEEEEQGENWNLIVIVNGYNAQSGSTMELLAANLCEASYGAEKKSLIVVLESNIGSGSVEPVEAQGLRGAKEINRLVQQNRQHGRIFSGYSLVGHSLGGLVARVIAVHVDLTPRVFVSLFTPHAGVGTFVAKRVMPPLLSITGIDKGAVKETLEQVSNKSVLVRLAQGEYLKAFTSFEKRVLYGSPADWLVDFGSAILTQINELQPWSASGMEIDDEYPLLHIRSFKQPPSACDDDTVRCTVLNSILRQATIERVQVDWSIYRPEKHSQKDMTPAESWELTRHLATQLGSSFALPRGSKCSVSADYCASGLECRRELCQAKLLRTEDCAGDSREVCEYLIVAINDILERFTVIVTSSGGGGHLVAAKNLQETLLEQADVDFEDLESVLNSQGHVLTAEAKAQAEAAIQHVRGGKPPLEMLDLMESECTTVFGVALGDWMSEQWNRRQRAGDIAGLKQLVAQQPWTQSIFGQSCRTYMTAVCDGMNSHGLPVTRLYTTQPLLLQSLLDACSSKVQVDLFMTDLPTTEAVHFFQPLKRLQAKLSSVWRRKFYLHSLPPPAGGRQELARLSGVPQGQIYLEQFMPVNRAFTKPTALPQPGEMFALKFKAQLPLEEDFLRQLGNPLLLQPQDEVILVMLGSQPTASAVEGYARASLSLPKLESAKRYVLLACGKPRVEAYAKLYADMVRLAKESEGTTTVLVPFTGQDAKEMLGRADITITRSGGMTAGELLALRTRKEDQKQMLLHVESVADKRATKILAKHLQKSEKQDALEAAFEESALEGMVPWEAGNARYLMKAVGAKVVIPKIFVAVLRNSSALPFTVDWTTLLRRRGFGLDEIAFATAPPSGCEAAVCTREFDDLPLPETVAKGNSSCLSALRYFNGPSLTSIHLHADAVANRRGRLKNGHMCNGASFMVRKRPERVGAFFFNIDFAAQAVTSSCGGRIMRHFFQETSNCDGVVQFFVQVLPADHQHSRSS